MGNASNLEAQQRAVGDIQLYEGDGTARVSQVPMGARVIRVMAPKLQANANFGNANEFVSLAGGAKAFRVTALAVPAGEAVIVATSTAQSDAVALKSTIDAITTVTTGKWDVADGTPFANVLALLAAAPIGPWVVAAKDSPFKSIGLQQTGGTLTLAVLETIEG